MSRILSSEVLNFIRFGQGALPPQSVFGDRPLTFFDWQGGIDQNTDNLVIEISEEDVYNLTHARFSGVTYFVDCLNQSRVPYSRQLAELLPEGHPFRAAHGLLDSKDSVANWLCSDPDLSHEERNLVRDIYFEPDNLIRARNWRKLASSLNANTFAWGDWREAFRYCQTNSVDVALDALHPRESGVIRGLAAGMSVSEIAEKFGVSETKIKGIRKLAFDSLMNLLARERGLVTSLLSQAGAACLSELAALIREFAPSRIDFPQSRVLVLITNGKLVQSSAGESIVIWQEMSIPRTRGQY